MNMIAQGTDWLTREQAAELAGVSVKFLENCGRRKMGPRYYSFTRQTVRYRRDEFEEWMEASRAPQGAK